MDIREAIEDEANINFIQKFEGLPIGAISIAPILLLKARLLEGKRFMAGVNVEDLLEEGFTKEDLKWMAGWDESPQGAVSEGYIISGNIVSSVFFEFVHWTLAFGKLLGFEIPDKVFGL